MNQILTIDYLRKNNLIIFECISGSNSYGTNTPESDTDIRGVFIAPLDYILKYGYLDQVSDEKNDVTFYELGRFIDLLIGNNPNILELLSIPEDCVIYRDPTFKLLEKNKDKFLTKKVRWTFSGYAIEQIKKARGYNKKMNWEEVDMKRKNVLDFCYVLFEGSSKLFEDWLSIYLNEIYGYSKENVKKYISIYQRNFGLANIDHSHNLYTLYDLYSYLENEKLDNKFFGVVSDIEKSNDVQLTSIPKEAPIAGYLSFNKDAYSSHCRRYNEYQTWLKERNPNRVKMNKEHGKNYDSKNMSHCMRLLDMCIEILDKHEIIVRRPKEHIDLLMKIRRGEMEYEDLLKMAEEKIATLDEKCNKSSLHEKVDQNVALELLLKMRKHFYKLK